MKGFLDVQSPIFRPVLVRLPIVLICDGWALFELLDGSVFWAILFGAAGVYLTWQFFVVWNPEVKEDNE